MSLLNQNVRYKNYDPSDKSNPYGLLTDILSTAPANSSLTGAGAPTVGDGKNGDLWYSDDGQIYKKVDGVWETLYSIPGSASSGQEAISAIANVGTGSGLFKNKVDSNAFFKNIKAGANITLNEIGDDIIIDGAAGQMITADEVSLTIQGMEVSAKVNGLFDIGRLNDTVSTTTNQPILATTGLVTAPAYSFSSDPQSGIFIQNNNEVNISSAGVSKLEVKPTAVQCNTTLNAVSNNVQTSGRIYTGVGNVASPSFAFISDPSTGISVLNNNEVNISSAGVSKLAVKPLELTSTVPLNMGNQNITSAGRVYHSFGTPTQPSITFQGRTNQGFYSATPGIISLQIGGQVAMAWRTQNPDGNVTTLRLRPNLDNALRCGDNGYGWSGVYSYAFVNLSDERLKNNIMDMPEGLDFIKLLNPKCYEWKDDTRKHAGLIAQDVADVIYGMGKTLQNCDFVGNQYLKNSGTVETTAWRGAPRAPPIVDENGETTGLNDDTYTIKFNAIVSAMINAIKELEVKNNALEARIAILEQV